MKNPVFADFVALMLAAAFVAGTAAGQTAAPKADAKKSAPAAKATGTSPPRNTLAKMRASKEINVAFSSVGSRPSSTGPVGRPIRSP